MLMALPTAQQVAEKWTTRTAAAAEDYARGVAETDKDPTALAIAAGPRLLRNFTEAFQSGRWANGLRKVGKSGWQAAVASKGQTNFSTGVQAATGKVETAFGPLLAFEQSLAQRVHAMPNVTDGDREQRMLAWVRGMRTFNKS
jgi:hypothetical protein